MFIFLSFLSHFLTFTSILIFFSFVHLKASPSLLTVQNDILGLLSNKTTSSSSLLSISIAPKISVFAIQSIKIITSSLHSSFFGTSNVKVFPIICTRLTLSALDNLPFHSISFLFIFSGNLFIAHVLSIRLTHFFFFTHLVVSHFNTFIYDHILILQPTGKPSFLIS
ncbi:MAG: hypothetical protein U9Q66_02240, partial [Patescibacteria group bacterium]|nr:hypothetical protein [Patescibacteria group bacterium]